MSHKLKVNFIGCAILASLTLVPAVSQAQVKASVSFHDKRHNDDHEWNDHENQAYRMWMKDKHRKDVEFSRLNARDQQSYWDWRHTHSDAALKIDIR